jgi:hypothetical protein
MLHAGGEGRKGRRPRSPPKYVASLRVVDVSSQGPVQRGALERGILDRDGPDPFIMYSMVLVVFPGNPLQMMMRSRSF